jgi:anti-sigma factor RsiW
MNCRTAERWLLRRHDGRLSPDEEQELNGHLRTCRVCSDRESGYQALFSALSRETAPPPRPMFWERLEARIAEKERENGWGLVRLFCRRAIPVSLALSGLVLGAILLFSPAREAQLSAGERLLLRNDNPLVETRTLLDNNKLEDKNMMLIFASAEDYAPPQGNLR